MSERGKAMFSLSEAAALIPGATVLGDGSVTFDRVSTDEDGFSAHTYFMTNPSLSGRGKALRRPARRAAALAADGG